MSSQAGGGRRAPGVVLTAETFDDVVQHADVPILVDFWDAGCAPCVQLHPVLQEIADEFETRVLVGSVDVAAHRELADRFGVASVPTLLVFMGGSPVRRLVGARPKRHIVRELSEHLQ